ncbi:MAG: PAS domain S-box protein [Terracidiphilus sp.]
MRDPTFCFALGHSPRLVSVGGDVEGVLGFIRGAFLASKVHLKDLIHREDAGVAESLFSADLKDRSGVFNIRVRHADGRIRCVKGQYTKKPGRAADEVLLDLILEDARKVREPGDGLLVRNFKTLIEQTGDYVYIKNRNHVFLAASRAVPNLTDTAKDPSELVGKTDYDIHPEEIADIAYRLEAEAIVEGQRVNEIQQLVAQGGSKCWIDNRKYPINGPDGEIIGIFGVAPDVTEHVEAEVRLRETDEWLRDAQEIAGLSNYALDIPNKIWHISPELEQLLGIDAAYGRELEKIWPLIHPDDHAEMAEHFKGYFTGERTHFDSEYRILRHTDGAMRWVHTFGRLKVDSQGKALELRGTVQDITERKLTEAALRESEETLREAQRIAGLGSYRLNVDAGQWTSSDVLDQIFGIDKEYEHTVEGWVALLHPDDRQAMSDYFRHEVLGQGRLFDKEYRILRRSDGVERWVHGIGRLTFGADGRPATMHGTIQDITERKLAEAGLRESKELLQLFIEHAPVSLAMLDREMRYVAVSRQWLEIHDLNGRELIGHSHYEIFPTVPESWKEQHCRALAGEVITAGEATLQKPDGGLQWLRREIRPWVAGDGQIGGIIIFSEDITERKKSEAALRENKELLQLFVEHAPVALAMFDREMRYVAVSKQWLKNLNLVGQEVLGRSHYDVITSIPETWKLEHRRALAGETIRVDEDRIEHADGKVDWLHREILPWRASDGSIGGIVVLVEDITQRKQTEERLRLAATVFTGAREGITITDRSGTILEVNEAFARITGYTHDEVLGRNPRLLQSGLQSKEFYRNMWDSLLRSGHWSGEIWNRTKSGDIYAEVLHINAIRDANGKVEQYVGMFTDITEIKEQEQKLERITHYDALSGLPNRTLLADRLRQAMAHAHRSKRLLAVAYFDIDGFKSINDGYGHSTGDALLAALALRMKRALREGDTLARLGGDEFAAVILDLDNIEACVPTLNRLLAAAAEEAQIGEVMLRVSASAGVAFYPQAADVDADVLLRQAGQAMYQAKLEGRSCFSVYDPSQDLLVRDRNENIEHIRRALTAGQFVLYYQPKVNMRSGKVVGAEALIRWQHPERGLLPPGMFLPVIEDHPLAVELGDWVIESALTQMESWQAEGFELPVSVNVSAIDLQQPDFADRLRARLAAHPHVKPSSLELEVLETSAMQDVVRASQVLTACREIGVSISLDDFGTGYSSLIYLKRLPANVLKIDQSFVLDMLEEPENLTILEGVLGLAAAFRRQVIAEGVETTEHGLMLLQMGCDFAQGYGIAAAMPARELRAWTAAWRPDPRWADVPVLRPDNQSVLYATVEHHAWLGAFEACLQGKRATPPPLDASQCRVGAWLEGEKNSAHGMLAPIQAIETLHQRLHVLAAEIFRSHRDGGSTQRLLQLRQLHYLQDKCLKRLRIFA